MDGDRFDQFTKLVGSARSRRRVLKMLAGGALGGVASAVGLGRANAARLRSVGNSCAANSDCASGLCVQESRTRKICHCISVNDCPAATTPCHAAACLATGYCGSTITLDAPCDDGDACTSNDRCQANGTCAGTPLSCPLPDQCHLPGACNPADGTCSNPNQPDGTACDDGDACTQSDACLAGVCVGGNPVVCTASDQCHAVGTCNPADGSCSNPIQPDGTACDDGNAATCNDVCTGGVCAGGACPDPCVANPCSSAACPDFCSVCLTDPNFCPNCPFDPNYCAFCEGDAAFCSLCQSDPNFCFNCQSDPNFCANCPLFPSYCEVCQGDAEFCAHCPLDPNYCLFCQSDAEFCAHCQSDPAC